MSREGRERSWFRLGESDRGKPTEKQEDWIREYAYTQGFRDLRGFATWMRSKKIDYYDILEKAIT